MNQERENQAFWRLQALAARKSGQESRLAPDRDRSADVESLWAFAQGTLPDDEHPALWKLLARRPELLVELNEMGRSLEQTIDLPAGRVSEVWSRVAATGAVAAAVADDAPALGRRVFDAAVRLGRKGLELVSTTGRPAFAPAMARSGGTEAVATAAMEFMTSAGMFTVTVDQVDDATCHLTVAAARLADRLAAEDLDVELRDLDDALFRSEPLVEGRARLENAPLGQHQIVICTADGPVATFTLDLSATEEE